ncbi:Pls/PosA family non-ribosomal peptide synthetase [Geodermatophilus sp. URMC 60]
MAQSIGGHGPVRDQAVLVGELGPAGHRWRPGERLEQVFERQVDALAAAGRSDQLAVDAGDQRLSYVELDVRANRLAHLLRRRGVAPGSRVALLCDEPVATYTALLAVLKAGAAYVPLDLAFPADRISYIAEDAGVGLVVTTAGARGRLDGLPVPVLCLDDDAGDAGDLAAEDDRRPEPTGTEPDAPQQDDDLCYVVYTSGTTGRPKGVMIDHSAICHFVGVAAEVYGVRPDDRVYQGLTIAFDFSVEEIWVAWAVGATLVPRPPGGSLLGADLHEFLTDRRVTALCCVPTLLATLDDDLPAVRFLLVSGEACPQDLVARWHRPGRRFLNTYGPTETTVTATLSVVDPDRPVTLGSPLPGYSVTVLDPDGEAALPPGRLGEIAIAGVGLATGYLNRPDLTERAFVPDRVGLPDNPSGRLYRTGDLGCIVDGEVEYHGRIDTQVKIRGYRIELTEIESVLLQLPGVAQAVVSTYEPAPGTVELVGYYTLRGGTASLDVSAAYTRLRGRLPMYMVPAYLEELPVIPMTTSDKADRKALPPPRGPRRLSDHGPCTAPENPLEEALADVVGAVLGAPGISVTSNLFDDLGADSLLLARICAKIRERDDLPAVATKDVYQHPTVRRLAAVLAVRRVSGPPTAVVSSEEPPATRAARHQHVACGALQLLVFLAWASLIAAVVAGSNEWITHPDGFLPTYERAVVLGGAVFLGACLLPIAAKWLLIGRWRAERFPVWSMKYLRFWVVKRLVRMSPLVLFHGSPLNVLYLRALGARVGPGALVLTSHVPVCTDLLTIGTGAVLQKNTHLNGYRVVGGVVEIGPVSIGRDAVVAESSVLDVYSTLGDGAELAHASSLNAGQSVPAGQRWLGTPAEPSERPPRPLDAARCGPVRRALYGALQLAVAVFVHTPLVILVATFVLPAAAHDWASERSLPGLLWHGVWTSSVVFWGVVVGSMLLAVVVPRSLRRCLPADRVFRLYGWRWAVQRTVARVTNVKTHAALFGDSSAIVHWLRGLGWQLSPVEQTGSNFGMGVAQDVPSLSVVGSGTMVSDGFSMNNAEFSGTSFRVRRAAVGARCFVGNNVVYPAGARTGENCLLATKVHVPVDGPVRQDVGLLGSPPFEIPRSVERDRLPDGLAGWGSLRAALRAKAWYNARTAGHFLLVRWVPVVVVVSLWNAALSVPPAWEPVTVVAALVAAPAVLILYWALVDRMFPPLRPLFCSIYDRRYWRHERYWKVPGYLIAHAFNGTPLKPLVWRAFRVRVGRRVFDDGAIVIERSLTRIGDDCTLNEASVIQGHSMENGVFKTDHIEIGAGCTIGPAAFVHYGVTMGPGAVLEADAFLMKGEQVGPGEHWAGNPARVLTAAVGPSAAPPVGAPSPPAAGVGAAADPGIPPPRGRPLGVDVPPVPHRPTTRTG